MVVSALAGLVVVGLGLFGLVALTSFIVHWLAIGAGFIGATALFKNLLEMRPLDITDSAVLNNILYGAYSVVAGFLLYKLVEAALTIAGILVGLLLAGLLVALYYFGPLVVLGAGLDLAGIVSDLAGGE